MDILSNLLWMIAIWWMLSRMLRTVRLIQHQRLLQEKKENQMHFEQSDMQSNYKQQSEVPLEMVEDPVCGKFVEKHRGYQLSRGTESFYFCSWDCREKFIKEHLKQPE
ncbi:MAG: YHS domain-containing protein [Epulopiscium sp.]|nr:YHS domain-containing protein [Candidatus Epulonipiscium sp.]